MRRRVEQGGLVVQVIAGNNAVFLGFDLSTAARAGCLGFAIHRVDHTDNEAYWLCGFKTFRSVVPDPSSSEKYLTNKHPVQSMWWGDYSAKPAHDYTYKVVPLYGTPSAPAPKPAVSASVRVTTNDPETGTHGIYFNRGVAASQAYSVKFAKFGTRTPKDMSDSEQTELKKWLSRGLHEALIAFITRGASPGLVIRAAVFEFTEPSVLAAFSEARSHGADVQIIYHDKDGTDEARDNNAAIAEAHLSRKMLIRRKHPQIAHNKFIVRGVRAANGSISGEQVWTGSTNLSRGGIFGHSNVGHVIRDASIARTYLDYWAQLADVARRQQVDDTKTVSAATRAFKSWVSAQNPFSGSDLAEAGIHVLFSPRTELDPLHWYAKGFATSPGSTYLTLPFGMDEAFETALAAAHQPGGPLRFVMLNKKDDHQEVWAADHCIQVAVGAKGGPDLLSRWAKETLTGFNRVYYLHTKILLLNALSATPTTISGSANFSEPSVMANDENVPIITGDLDVADVYFTEYTRIFQHFYARWWAQNLGPAGSDSHSYLSEDDSWQAPYWDPDSPKSRKRDLFANQVAGN